VAANAQTLSSSQNMEFKATVNRMTSLVPGATLTPPSAAALTSGSPTASSTSTGPTRPVPRQPGTVRSVRGTVRGTADMGVQAVTLVAQVDLDTGDSEVQVDPDTEDPDSTVDLGALGLITVTQVDQVDPGMEDSTVDLDTGALDQVDPGMEDSTVDLDTGALDQVDPGMEDSTVDLDMALDPAGTEGLGSTVVTQLEMVVRAS